MSNPLTTSKCIFLCYPRGASGKFLTNCLLMNGNFFPQINVNNFDNYFEKNIVEEIISESNKIFSKKVAVEIQNDIDDKLFFGVENMYGLVKIGKFNIDEYKEKIVKNLDKVFNSEKYFFRTVHYVEDYKFYRRIWGNPTVLNFVNCTEWIAFRNNIKKRVLYQPIESIKEIDATITFNVNSLFNKQDFIKEYINILSCLGLEIVNQDYVETYYDLYYKFISGK